MTFALYTNSVSAHQLPLAREIVKRVGAENFRYIYTGTTLQGGNQEVAASEPWIIKDDGTWLETCDVLLCGGLRPFGLFERRAAKGLKTFYQSERWFKPIHGLPGWLRLLHSGYLKMVCRFRRLAADRNFHVLPIGPHAKRDFRLLGIPGSKMMDWGYFVAPSILPPPPPRTSTSTRALRVLWVGRMLALKRVDTIIRAVVSAAKHGTPITCTIVGSGPEESRLKSLAKRLEQKVNKSIVHLHLPPPPQALFTFLPPVPLAEVRELMRSHDVYVFSSNGEDGWGAVVSEAMEEGMCVLGSRATGAPPTLLPSGYLFNCGDWRALSKRLARIQYAYLPTSIPPGFTAVGAALRLLEACR